MSNKDHKARILQRQKKQRLQRAIAFGAIVVGVLVLAGFLLKPVLFRADLPAIAGQVIDVAADMGGFDMKLIRVKAGQPVTIRLRSLDNSHHTDGGGKHQWAVDELGQSVIAPPEGTNSITFTPDKPGTYTFYCDICCGGRANPTMQGTLVVEA
ncbi:MAG: cupredoxin domain-containing protein [Chloroflexi bacterium]|nr:cupredoxin domain-containing protein [Chloroflexota bacterium]